MRKMEILRAIIHLVAMGILKKDVAYKLTEAVINYKGDVEVKENVIRTHI